MVIQSPTITDDIIITSLPKTMAKIHFLLNSSHCVTSYGHFCKILALLMIPAHQIWSCYMTQDAYFENLLFCPDSTFNIRNSHKISSGKALYFRSYQQKTSLENTPPPPVPLGLNVRVKLFFDSYGIWFERNISLFQAISSPHQVIFK